MKTIVCFLLLSNGHSCFAQVADSIIIKEVNRLIQESRDSTATRNYEVALAINSQAESLALDKLGKETAEYARACYNHGRILDYEMIFEESEKWYLSAKNIFEKVLGKESEEYALCLRNLSGLYADQGLYPLAEPIMVESRNILALSDHKKHIGYAAATQNLAVLYWEMGQLEIAEPLFLDAIRLYKLCDEKDIFDLSSAFNGIAILYSDIGRLDKAEQYYLESKKLLIESDLKETVEYSYVLNNLAIFYASIGQTEHKEAIYLECKDLRLKLNGPKHIDYAEILLNLGDHYMTTNQPDLSLPLFLEAKNIYENALGVESPEYAVCLNFIGLHYMMNEQYEESEPYMLESLRIYGLVFGQKHPIYARFLSYTFNLYYEWNKYDKAEPYILEALSICKETIGEQHPDYRDMIENIAALYAQKGDKKKATSYYLKANLLNRTFLTKALHHLSEQEMHQYLLTFEERQSNLLTYNQCNNGITEISEMCYDNTLFYKGFLLNARNRSQQLIKANPQVTEKYHLLKSYFTTLAAEYATPITQRIDIAELEEKANQLEKEISREIVSYGEEMRQVVWKEVQQQLKPNQAAIEFVQYKNIKDKNLDSTMYAAILLLPEQLSPQFIILFEQKELEALINIPLENKTENINLLYSEITRGINTTLSVNYNHNLYEVLWKRLEEHLSGITKIYYSPAGLLHRLNLSAIPISETNILADKYTLIELSSTRQLVFPNNKNYSNNTALLYGGIQFKSDSTIENSTLIQETYATNELSFQSSDIALRGGEWNYLPGTESEVSTLKTILENAGLEVQLQRGAAATELAFKNQCSFQNTSARIVHIATHGYFFPDPKTTNTPASKNDLTQPVFTKSDHPMLRSGLILAGGNTAWKGANTHKGMEDGILTAYEISQLNLSNTELVVLSACETGLGDIQGNEGVYGLQRAFKIAGAKYIIMSLWQIPDQQTSMLMTTLYKKWLEEKMTLPDAFHAAQKSLRDAGLDPYQWAGFVLVE